MNNSVKINSFVMRQTKSSGKTYSKLSFKQIAEYAEKKLAKKDYKRGYRDGVIIINVEKDKLHNYICPYTIIKDNTKLIAEVNRRRNDEEPYVQIKALNGDALETGSVEIILYHHDVLAETNEQDHNDGWELIAFHAIPVGIKNMPMGPITMMRNQLQLKGGTKGDYSSKEWAEAVRFWQKYAVLSI